MAKEIVMPPDDSAPEAPAVATGTPETNPAVNPVLPVPFVPDTAAPAPVPPVVDAAYIAKLVAEAVANQQPAAPVIEGEGEPVPPAPLPDVHARYRVKVYHLSPVIDPKGQGYYKGHVLTGDKLGDAEEIARLLLIDAIERL